MTPSIHKKNQNFFLIYLLISEKQFIFAPELTFGITLNVKYMGKCNSLPAFLQTPVNYFKFSELIKTSVGVSNYPQTSLQLDNLSRTWYILNGLRARFGAPIYINSCYRSPDVNRAVGGVDNSYHLQGRAADIRTLPHLMDDFRTFLNETKEQYQHLFVEFIDKGTFFHIAV